MIKKSFNSTQSKLFHVLTLHSLVIKTLFSHLFGTLTFAILSALFACSLTKLLVACNDRPCALTGQHWRGTAKRCADMYLHIYLDDQGKKVYTLKVRR